MNEIDEYDQWTINYLRGVGVEGALLERVERLAKDASLWKARALAAQDREALALRATGR